MQRIETLLQKLTELSKLKEKASIIEIDLMMDYTKVIYADLIEWRNRTAFTNTVKVQTITTPSETTPVTNGSDLNKVNQTKDIQTLIGINDKYLYISELFSNNKEEYQHVIDMLNTFNEFIQADNWLKSNHDWSNDNETAQSFMKLVADFYTGNNQN